MSAGAIQYQSNRLEMRLRCIKGRAINLRSRLGERSQAEFHRCNTLQKQSNKLVKSLKDTDYSNLGGCAPVFASEYLGKLSATQRDVSEQQARFAHVAQRLEQSSRLVSRCEAGEEKLNAELSLDAAAARLRGECADVDLDNCQPTPSTTLAEIKSNPQPTMEPPMLVMPQGLADALQPPRASSLPSTPLVPVAAPTPSVIDATLPDGTAISVTLVGASSVTVREVTPSVLLPRWLPQAESQIKARLADQGIRLVSLYKHRR